MPGSSTADQNLARSFYAVLTARVSAITATGVPDEELNFKTLGPLVRRAKMEEYGLYVQDTWKFRPNLTFTAGLRWEVQNPFEALNDNWTRTTEADLYGVSGAGNLFRPGVLTGGPTIFTAFSKGDKAWKTQYANFAPSFGFSYSPNFSSGFMHKLVGNSGQTVLRGGFSMAFVREGINTLTEHFRI